MLAGEILFPCFNERLCNHDKPVVLVLLSRFATVVAAGETKKAVETEEGESILTVHPVLSERTGRTGEGKGQLSVVAQNPKKMQKPTSLAGILNHSPMHSIHIHSFTYSHSHF